MEDFVPSLNYKKNHSKDGYIYARVQSHPRATSTGYVLEHRIIMENHLGRYLSGDELVHHDNEIKNDNRIENLILTTRSEHSKHHAKPMAVVKLKCPECKTLFQRDKYQTHLCKVKFNWTSCSRSCRAKFSRKLQLGRLSKEEYETAIQENVQELFFDKS
jgi:hypothetical protein